MLFFIKIYFKMNAATTPMIVTTFCYFLYGSLSSEVITLSVTVSRVNERRYEDLELKLEQQVILLIFGLCYGGFTI